MTLGCAADGVHGSACVCVPSVRRVMLTKPLHVCPSVWACVMLTKPLHVCFLSSVGVCHADKAQHTLCLRTYLML